MGSVSGGNQFRSPFLDPQFELGMCHAKLVLGLLTLMLSLSHQPAAAQDAETLFAAASTAFEDNDYLRQKLDPRAKIRPAFDPPLGIQPAPLLVAQPNHKLE